MLREEEDKSQRKMREIKREREIVRGKTERKREQERVKQEMRQY